MLPGVTSQTGLGSLRIWRCSGSGPAAEVLGARPSGVPAAGGGRSPRSRYSRPRTGCPIVVVGGSVVVVGASVVVVVGSTLVVVSSVVVGSTAVVGAVTVG